MKAFESFEQAYKNLLAEISDLKHHNNKLAAAAADEKRKSAAAPQLADELRALREQLAKAQRDKQRSDKKHAATIDRLRERASYWRTQLAQYRRELVLARSVVRNQNHD